MGQISRLWIAPLALLLLAQRDPVPETEQSVRSRIEAAIPERPYYPHGYRDLRIAAALHSTTARRPLSDLLFEFDDEPPYYDIIDCNADAPDPDGSEDEQIWGSLAMQVARIEDDLTRLGYRREVFEAPLLAFERDSLDMGAGELDLATPLAEALEANRQRLQPDKPRIVADGGCGAGELSFRIRTAPAGGRVWIVNAFAFHVCSVRQPDPWALQACRWTEVDEDAPELLSGRYFYQARWPDGTLRRGTRLLGYNLADGMEEGPILVTIRR